MDFKQLEAFVNVVRLGSFSKAASALYLTQPTVSAHVTALEKELQTVLIVRTTKEVSVSTQGKALLEYAERMLELRDEAVARVKSDSYEDNRTINIAAPEFLINHILPRTIETFLEKHANTRFELTPLTSSDVEREVLKGAAQLGVVSTRHSSDKLKYHPIFSEPLVFAFPVGEKYDGIKTEDITREFLASQRVFVDRVGSGLRRETVKNLKKCGLRGGYESVAGVTEIMNRVADGKGITLVAESVSGRMGIEDCIRLVESPFPTKQTFFIITHKRFEMSKLSRAFVKHAKTTMTAPTANEVQ